MEKNSKENLKKKICDAIDRAALGSSGKCFIDTMVDEMFDAFGKPKSIFDMEWNYPGKRYGVILDEVLRSRYPNFTLVTSDNMDTKEYTISIEDPCGVKVRHSTIRYEYVPKDSIATVFSDCMKDFLYSIVADGIHTISFREEAYKKDSAEQDNAERTRQILEHLFEVNTLGKYDSIATYKKKHLIKELAEILAKK